MTSTAPALPAPGFDDPARDAQRAFRAVLDALARPATGVPLAGPARPPTALGPGLAALALTLLDTDCTVWLGGALADDAATTTWLDFHTGARRTADPAAAGFLITPPAALPPLEALEQGTDEAPHLSATVILDVRGCAGPDRFTASGPGVNGTAELPAPWATDGFASDWARNAARFPRGVDLLLADAAEVTGLPRSTRLSPLAPGQED
ncbi:MAG: phosphonate C-P lyase system protein PhnH [Streptosporangiales bacterium]|nr:phosphonate C-P lyase system protein PhnH [Streptosporangiales bacterium]